MTPSRKQPGVASWATVVVVVVLVAYPLSFGPACWIESRVNPGDAVQSIYYPLLYGARYWPNVRVGLTQYAELGSPRHGYWDLDKFGRYSWWRLD